MSLPNPAGLKPYEEIIYKLGKSCYVTSLVVLYISIVETEPRRMLDVICDSRQLSNGLIFTNITWTIPSDPATLESVEEFVVWLHWFPDNSFVTDALPREVDDFKYQVSIHVTIM